MREKERKYRIRTEKREEKHRKIRKSFGDFKKSSIFAPAIEKRWRDAKAATKAIFTNFFIFILFQSKNLFN
ncbi:unknown [Bacteroides intestinalis CAG:315]|nr:unknown [Bacteroides intestinalis CAG:315]